MINAASSYWSSSSRMFVHHDNTDRKNVTFKSTNFSIRAHSSSSAGESVVARLDYGAGNVQSVRNAIRHLGYDIKDINTPEDILNANRLIFPGVGAFVLAMDVLNHNGRKEEYY
ncbi:hypothetical protein RJ641_000415 [Dillenia turbinata]|uniref:Imidazole glycerol phosphate synthase hisHF n=1 Tax=Dillenia turbinata TaxID=194707 RepID=A0AAN8WEL7_9MAGN